MLLAHWVLKELQVPVQLVVQVYKGLLDSKVIRALQVQQAEVLQVQQDHKDRWVKQVQQARRVQQAKVLLAQQVQKAIRVIRVELQVQLVAQVQLELQANKAFKELLVVLGQLVLQVIKVLQVQ